VPVHDFVIGDWQSFGLKTRYGFNSRSLDFFTGHGETDGSGNTLSPVSHDPTNVGTPDTVSKGTNFR
jgi:hypothetical protein